MPKHRRLTARGFQVRLPAGALWSLHVRVLWLPPTVQKHVRLAGKIKDKDKVR